MRILITICLVAAGCGDKATNKTADEPPAAEPAAAEPPTPAPVESEKPGWDRSNPFGVPTVEILDKKDDSFAVKIRMDHRPGAMIPAGRVPFTAEPYNITTKPSAKVTESDILGTGLALDLDGDGATTSTLSAGCHADGSITLGGRKLEPFAGGEPNPFTYPESIEGQVALYTRCTPDMLALGLTEPGKPIEVQHTEGPALQVLLIQQTGKPQGGTIELQGVSHEIHRSSGYEPYFGEADWAAIRWFMVPIDRHADQTEVSFRVRGAGDSELMIWAIPNVSGQLNERWRFDPGMERVGTSGK